MTLAEQISDQSDICRHFWLIHRKFLLMLVNIFELTSYPSQIQKKITIQKEIFGKNNG